MCRPDRSAGIVLMNIHSYVINLSSILSDAVRLSRETFQKDATEKTEQMLTKILKKMSLLSIVTFMNILNHRV